MTKLDELTQKARHAFVNATGPTSADDWRAAVLAVLAEVREMVPGEQDWPNAQTAEAGWNDACAEMLRRLDQTMEGRCDEQAE